MAIYVKISMVGPRPAQVNADAPLDEIVGQVIEHWCGRMAQVLPDKPDLIVVPEACDRPGNCPRARAKEHYEAGAYRLLGK